MEQRQTHLRCGLDHLAGAALALLIVIREIDDAGHTGLPEGAIALSDLGAAVGVARLGGGEEAAADQQVSALLPFQLKQPVAASLQQRRPLVHGPRIWPGAALPALVGAVVGVEDLAAGSINAADALVVGVGVGTAGGQRRCLLIEQRQVECRHRFWQGVRRGVCRSQQAIPGDMGLRSLRCDRRG